jgi:hypothetical protein
VNKFSIIFLIAIFSSIVLNPLFIKNGIPGFTVISLALGEESSDSDGGDSGEEERLGREKTTLATKRRRLWRREKDDSGDDEKDDSGDEEKDDSGDDETTD